MRGGWEFGRRWHGGELWLRGVHVRDLQDVVGQCVTDNCARVAGGAAKSNGVI